MVCLRFELCSFVCCCLCCFACVFYFYFSLTLGLFDFMVGVSFVVLAVDCFGIRCGLFTCWGLML